MGSTQLLSVIYGDDAIYVESFEKTGEEQGVGHVAVNPEIWQREKEPSFEGEIQSQEANKLTTTLTVKKEQMRGHFREDIALLLPGHKSVRAAGIALGRFLNTDRTVNQQKIYLSKYESVKFLNPVLPEQILKTTATLIGTDKNTVRGDAVQSVNGKESMQIRGMVVKQIQSTDEESVLLLDQIIEAAAQTVGLYVLENLQSDKLLPLFHGTGQAEILKSIQANDSLSIKTNKVRTIKARTMNIFTSDLQIYRSLPKTSGDVNEELVAEIKNLQGLLLPREEVLAKLH